MKNNSETYNNTDDYDDENEDLIPPRLVQFWTVLPFEILSLSCVIYLLYHLLHKRKLRKAIHNHVIIILMFFVFISDSIDNPLYLDAYLHHGRSSFPPSPAVCYIWLLVDYGVYGVINVLLAYASIERHIIIFHANQLLNTRLKRMIFHYIPLGAFSLYISGFYIGVIFFPPCETIFNYTIEVCGMSPCYESIGWLNLWDYLLHGIVCVLLEAIATIILLIRIIWKRYRAHQPVQWKKHRKTTIQLLSITALSMSITLPQSIISLIQEMVPGMEDFAYDVGSYFYYLTTFVPLFLPFVSLGSLPELWPKFLRCKKRRQRAVGPFTFDTNRNRTMRAHQQTAF